MQKRVSLARVLEAAVFSAGLLLMVGCGSAGTTTVTPPVQQASCTTSPVTIAHTGSGANTPQLVVLNTTTYPQAICNDGSAGAYVLRPGVGAAASRWVISLQGGSDCYDNSTCSQRAVNTPTLISTTQEQANPALVTLGLGGLQSAFASINPDFYDATQVQVLYCSSDYWSGAKTGTGTFNPNNDQTWNFQGRAILNAAIADLKANHGFNSAMEILFSGESAGGVGTYVNVNSVKAQAPSAARFVAMSDAGFGNNTALNFLATGTAPNYTDPNTPMGGSTSVAANLWNGTGDSVCVATTPGTGCYNAAQLLGTNGTITLPMLVIEAQKDTVQLNNNGVSQTDLTAGTFTTAETGYINYFAAQMHTALLTTNANVSIFSPDVLLHIEAVDNTNFTTSYVFPSTTLSVQQAMSAWYKTPCSAQRNLQN